LINSTSYFYIAEAQDSLFANRRAKQKKKQTAKFFEIFCAKQKKKQTAKFFEIFLACCMQKFQFDSF